jgi:hypothetical protein
MGNYLFGQFGLEKAGEAKRLTFELGLTVGLNIAPVIATIRPPPLGVNLVDIVTNTTTGTLCPAITFAGVTTTASWGGAVAAPIVGVEIADGLVTATGSFIGAFGYITGSTGAGNITLGSPVYGVTATGQFSAGVGMTFNLQFGLNPATAITNYLNSLNAAAGVVTALVTVVYLDR